MKPFRASLIACVLASAALLATASTTANATGTIAIAGSVGAMVPAEDLPLLGLTPATPNSFYAFRNAKTLIVELVEYNTQTCAIIDSGNYDTTQPPKHGTLSYGFMKGTLSGTVSCDGTAATFRTASYTWTDASNKKKDSQDEFLLEWKTQDMMFDVIYDFLAVLAPVISGPSEVWWFNDAQPKGFTTEITLTALPSSAAPFKWKVTAGDDEVELASEKTQGNTVMLKGTKGSPPGGERGDVHIEVNSAMGGPSAPFPLTVLQPYKAVPLAIPPDKPNPIGTPIGWWYISKLPYEVRDQFDNPVGMDIPVREHFTTDGATEQCKKCNWTRTDEGGGSGKGNGGVITDQVKGQPAVLPGFIADPVPQCPNNDCTKDSHGSSTFKVHCFPGEVYVGDGSSPPAPPKGVKIMTMIWERYQDHARHCNIVSPLDGSASTVNPCSCP